MRLNLVGLARARDLEVGDVAFVELDPHADSFWRWVRIVDITRQGNYRVLRVARVASEAPLPGAALLHDDDLVLVRSNLEVAHTRPRPMPEDNPQEGTCASAS